jgi:hypothetical protein
MDVLVFLGSPRKKGNSEVLTEALLEGVRDEGGPPFMKRSSLLTKLSLHPQFFSMASPPRPKLSSTEPRHSGTAKGFYKGKESGLRIRSERASSSPLPQPAEPKFLQEQSSP